MTREEAIKWLNEFRFSLIDMCVIEKQKASVSEAFDMAIEALKAQEWIPIKWHSITDEEREREGYPKDWDVFLDCDMPADGEEILVTTKRGYVDKDVCCKDGEYSLDSGWNWIEDIVAWRPMPEPYKAESEESHE